MESQQIDFSVTGKFSTLFLDYIAQNEKLDGFYHTFPTIENYEAQIQAKQQSYSLENRQVLQQALHTQYQSAGIISPQAIDLLGDEKTFTITTGHQLNIFTGPLYFHYKIITVINACRALHQKYPEYRFVPVYWMASEDHDFEEISYFKLFNKKYQWQTEQTGTVGKFNPQSLQTVLDELPEYHKVFQAYLDSETLAEATRKIVHTLYKDTDLLILDGDDVALKQLFRPAIQREIFDSPTHTAIEKTSEKLAQAGYKTQVYPREINLFYLGDGFRERIVRTEEGFEILNNLRFSASEMQAEIENSPEKFSPNVALRPVYQEIIMPNLSYTGGPGELAYWLQLQEVFDIFGVRFPLLLPRNFALVLNGADQKKMDKLGLSNAELFEHFDTLRKKYVAENTENTISLTPEIEELGQVIDKIKAKGVAVGLPANMFEAEKQRLRKSFEKIEKKIAKTEEQKFEQSLNQLAKLQEKLFPNGSLQERSENFQTFVLNTPEFLKILEEHFNPFDFRFSLLKIK